MSDTNQTAAGAADGAVSTDTSTSSDTSTEVQAEGADATEADAADNATAETQDGAATEGAESEAKPQEEAPAEEKPQEEEPKKPDVDARLIQLSKTNRALKGEIKSLKANHEQEIGKYRDAIAEVKPLIDLWERRHENPLKFLQESGFDLDKAIALYSGVKRELTADEKLAELEKKIAARDEADRKEREEAKKRADEEAERQKKEERQRQIDRHVSRIEDIAKKNPDKYPLTMEEGDGIFEKVFDVMVLAHGEGQRITHEEALEAVEAELTEAFERKAKRKGLLKPAPAAPAAAGKSPTPKPAPAKSLSASLAANAPAGTPRPPSVVPSDEEIEADFLENVAKVARR